METIDAFGTLTIGESGESKYFGPSAGSEAGADLTSDPILPPNAPELLINLSMLSLAGEGCPAGSDTFSAAMNLLFDGLPPHPRAWSLCETYLEHSSWHFQLVLRSDLIEEVLTPIYNAKQQRELGEYVETEQCISPHKFALLYLVFAQGVLVDLTLPANDEQGETFHYYARTALALRSFIDAPTVETVQAVLLMAHYRSGAGERYSQDDRDPARWHMDEKTAECRRRMFWEVYAADLFHSLLLGRPPSIELSYVDCAFPKAGEDSDMIYWNWKYLFARDIMGSAIKLTLAASPPAYRHILELDRKVREMVLPPALNVFLRSEDNYKHMSAATYLKSCAARPPREPAQERVRDKLFGSVPERECNYSSINTVYGTVSRLVDEIIVGSIATKAPSSSMASTAFMELGLAVDLFERGSGISGRARTGMVKLQGCCLHLIEALMECLQAILKKLKDKAFLVLSQHRSRGNSPSPAPPLFSNQEDGTDELALFGGQTHLMVSKSLSAQSPEWHLAKAKSNMPIIPSKEALNGASSTFVRSFTPEADVQEVHPSLVQYLSFSAPVALSADFTTLEPESLSLDQPVINRFAPHDLSFSTPGSLQTVPLNRSTDNPNSFNPSNSFYEDAPSMNTAPLDTWGSNDYTDLGMMLNMDNDMEEQWMSFMNESGMINPITYNA
ncbi:hypothetical protein HWV62_16252 [Athelia sp. TMB]|nr:hypothetical protein HWV62_16252 [Athelia sp. TMB]